MPINTFLVKPREKRQIDIRLITYLLLEEKLDLFKLIFINTSTTLVQFSLF